MRLHDDDDEERRKRMRPPPPTSGGVHVKGIPEEKCINYIDAGHDVQTANTYNLTNDLCLFII
jgi:hypothetical protein